MHRKESLLRPIFILNGLLALLAVALSFTGCGRSDEMKDATNTNTQTTQGATTGSTPASGSTSPASPSGAPPPSAGPALATADGDIPGIRVELQELKRTSGDVVNSEILARSVWERKVG